MSFLPTLERACADLGLSLQQETVTASERFRRLLEKWSSHIALTTVSSDREWAELHFAEAFWAAQFVPPGAHVADVGSGAGFPGLAMRLYRSDLQVTLLERNFKKSVFLQTAVSTLALPVSVHSGPAEKWSGWPDTAFALLRALRPSQDLLRALAASRIQLLHFRGARPDPLFEGWQILSDERYPLARGRWITVYAPPSP